MKHQWYILESREEYHQAIKRLDEIFDVKTGTPEDKELKLLVLLISSYEGEHFKFGKVDPVEMIKSRMEDLDLTSADLARAYGDKGTVSKVLNYKQRLSLKMIRVFSKLLRISPELLTEDYMLTKKPIESKTKQTRSASKKKKKLIPSHHNTEK